MMCSSHLACTRCSYHVQALPLRQAAPGWGAGCAMSKPPQLLAAVCAGLPSGQTASMLQTVPLGGPDCCRGADCALHGDDAVCNAQG